MNTVIGIDLRPRLALGRLAMDFLVHGATVFAIQHPLRQDDPVWAYAVRADFSKLSYAPMLPAAAPASPDVSQPSEAKAKTLFQRLWGSPSEY